MFRCTGEEFQWYKLEYPHYASSYDSSFSEYFLQWRTLKIEQISSAAEFEITCKYDKLIPNRKGGQNELSLYPADNSYMSTLPAKYLSLVKPLL